MSTNIALNKHAKASHYIEPYVPSKAVDGVLAPISRWVGSSPIPSYGEPAPVWLVVDLGAEFWVNRWVVKQMGSAGWKTDYNLCDYKLQGSNYYYWQDDKFLHREDYWWDLDSVVNNSASQTDRTLEKPWKVRFVRVYVTKGLRCNTNFASIVDLEVYAADPTSAKLTGLSISAGTLEQPFGSTTNNYTASVGYDSSTITVTATAEDSRASIKVNGVPATSGDPSKPVSLNPGVTTPITVEVTPYIGDPQNYVISVTRASSPYLTNLVVKSGRTLVPLTPSPFNKNILHYEGNINTSEITVTATVDRDGGIPQINHGGVPIDTPVTFDISVGVTVIPLYVTSAIGNDSRNYTLTINFFGS